MSAVSTIRNIGPAMESEFRAVGVVSAEQLRDLGADAAYRKLLDGGVRPHFIGYYALVMGLQGRPWNDCQGKEKSDLRARFDALVADAAPRFESTLARALDEVGVRLSRT